MATIPIHNPQLPFLGSIPGGMRPGLMLRFRGVVHQEGRLQINIQCGAATEPRDDVALHLSIRPRENCIVRNNYTNRVWGTEERYGHSPIYFGQPFDLLVLAEHSQYKIAVNGAHFATFTHRLPLTRATFVSLAGEGTIHMIGVENDTTGASNPGPTAPPMGNLPVYPPPGAQVCPMPYPPYPSHGPPHGGVPVFPGMPGAPAPPPYTPYPTGGYPGMSGQTTSYPTASTDPYNNNHNAYNPGGFAPQSQPYYPGSQPMYPQTGHGNNGGILGALGGGTAAAILTGVAMKGGKKKMKKNKALKYAAGAGALGLGGYAISRALRRSSSSSSSSSD
ncbi:galectin-9-like isoform X2 [Culicoides brevitarsis]|uniref:galectin-9-like isoform X2 n=1 Tax=Culicoides brevitarsis TaxID=469753 RepID=UPI00307C5773